jgi:hypothetical protein
LPKDAAQSRQVRPDRTPDAEGTHSVKMTQRPLGVNRTVLAIWVDQPISGGRDQ